MEVRVPDPALFLLELSLSAFLNAKVAYLAARTCSLTVSRFIEASLHACDTEVTSWCLYAGVCVEAATAEELTRAPHWLDGILSTVESDTGIPQRLVHAQRMRMSRPVELSDSSTLRNAARSLLGCPLGGSASGDV
jgi:hypothetical protein